MNLFPADIEMLRGIDVDANFKITNHQRIKKLMNAGLVVWEAMGPIGWFLTHEGKKVMQKYSQFSASEDTYGPSDSGIYSVGIDMPIAAESSIHYRAIEFHGKDKKAIEALRDEVVAFLNSRESKKFDVRFAKRVAARVLEMAEDTLLSTTNAEVLRNSAYSFIAGLEHYFPPSKVWEDAEQHVKNSDDPEYKDYLRLKEKFGGK